MMALLKELQRRNVYRVGAAYIVTAWLVLQVADVVLGNLDAPVWWFEAILVFLVIGFPLALILAWVFELTPEGIKRESEIGADNSVTRATGRKLDRAIMVVLAIAVVYFVTDKWLGRDGQEVDTLLERSIAVLPFSNRSAVAEDAFFVDGMQDDILTQLANLSGLEKVISRTSTEQYRDTDKPIPQIGQELAVAAILEGSVQRAGDRVRINMQLIDTATDEHLWAATYDRELKLESLFEVQTEISRQVVAALHATLTEKDEERLALIPTDSVEAYEQFVLGRRELSMRTAESVREAAAHFEKAIEFDPEYAMAYVGLADAIAMQVEYAGLDFAASAGPRQENIDKALNLNPRLGEAYASLGFLRYWGGDLEGADLAFERAIELSPNYAPAYHWYSIYLRNRAPGRREESLELMRKALSLDPAAPILAASLVDNLRFVGQHDEAKKVSLQGARQHPSFPSFYIVMSNLLQTEGRLGEAAAWADSANELNPLNFTSRLGKCRLLVELDDPDTAEVCLNGLRADFSGVLDSVLPALVELQTRIMAVRGDVQAAVDYAQKVASASADPRLHGNLIGPYIWNAEWEKPRPILEAFAPHLFADGEIIVQASEIELALSAAATMREGDDWSERGRYLAGQILDTLQTMQRTRGVTAYGFVDVSAHAMRGEGPEGMAALREAIDSGWRLNWWMFRVPTYDIVRDDPVHGHQFSAMIAELEADVAEQREWYYAHENDSLQQLVKEAD